MLKDMKIVITYFAVIALIFFVSGFGWGQWFAERVIRKERSGLEQGRLLVSVPMHRDEASRVFESIKTLVELSEETRKSIIDSMSASEGQPFSVTALSCDHEMRRLDLIEQALDERNMAAVDKAISLRNIGNIKDLDELMER